MLKVTMVVQDSRMVFVPIMPGHKKRLPKLMASLVKNPDSQGAVTLSVTAAADGVREVLRRVLEF
jgi:ubiquitin-activating enzyme E1-like protein 2